MTTHTFCVTVVAIATHLGVGWYNCTGLSVGLFRTLIVTVSYPPSLELHGVRDPDTYHIGMQCDITYSSLLFLRLVTHTAIPTTMITTVARMVIRATGRTMARSSPWDSPELAQLLADTSSAVGRCY